MSEHRQLEFIFNPRRVLPKVRTSIILKWTIRLIGLHFDMDHAMINVIPRVDELSRLRFYEDQKLNMKDTFDDNFSFYIGTDVVSLDRMTS